MNNHAQIAILFSGPFQGAIMLLESSEQLIENAESPRQGFSRHADMANDPYPWDQQAFVISLSFWNGQAVFRFLMQRDE